MTGTANHGTAAALLGAWALNACSAAERDVVEDHLRTCPACAREARDLRAAAAALAGADRHPPAGSLVRLRAAVPGRRRPATPTIGYAAAYAAHVAALDLLLSGLGPGDWDRIAAYGQLTVRDLVAHLAATDGLVAAALGLPVRPPVQPGQGLAARTDAVLAVERARAPELTRRSWRAQADTVCHALRVRAPAGSQAVTVGRPLTLADVLTARAFETWIHGEDIAAATGRPVVPPLPEHVRRMAEFAVRVLPEVVCRRVPPPHDRFVRLHLTGAGGGTWTVPLAPSAVAAAAVRPAVVLAVDVVEFCRLAADRRDPGRIAAEIDGDAGLGHAFLAAVPAMAAVP